MQVFGVFNRRYECTYCGLAVCLQHSAHKNSSAQGMTPDFYRTCDHCLTDMRSEDSDEDIHHTESSPKGMSKSSKDFPGSDCREQSRRFTEETVPTSPRIFKPAPPPKPCRSPIPGNTQSPFNGQPQPPSDVFGGVGSTRPVFRTYTTPPRAVSAPQASDEPRYIQERPIDRSPPAPPSTSTSQELSSIVRAHSAAAEERSRSQGMSGPIGKTAYVEAAPKPKPIPAPASVSVPLPDGETDLPTGTFQQRLEAMKKKSDAVTAKVTTPQLRSSTAPRLGSTHLSPEPSVDLSLSDRQHQGENNGKLSIQEMHVKMRGTGTFQGIGERKHSEGSLNGVGQIYGRRTPTSDPNKHMAQSPGGTETQGSRNQSNLPSPSHSNTGSPTRTAAQQKASASAPVAASTSIPVLRPGTPAASGSQHVTVASQIFREKLEALNSKSIVPPPRARAVLEPPQAYTGVIVFGIPDEAEPFVYENPLQNNQSRNTSPSHRNLPNNAAAASGSPPMPPPQSSATARQTPPPPAPVHIPVPSPVRAVSAPAPPPAVVPPPPAVDPATLPRWGSNTQTPSPAPAPSPKRPLSTGFADRISQFNSANSSPASTKLSTVSKQSPIRQKVVENTPTPGHNISALCVKETQPVSPIMTGQLVAHSTPPKQVALKETRETNVHMNSSCQVSDTKSSQPRPPSSSLSYSSSSVVKKDVDSGSESASSKTTIESKVSTSTVTYQYEYDVDDDEDDEPPGPPGHSPYPKNASSIQQKLPKGFNEKDVRRKMEADGLSPDVIEEFLRHISIQCGTGTGGGAGGAHSREDSTMKHTSPNRSSAAFPVSGKVQVLPPTMTSPCQSDTGGGSVYATYSKMISMRIPEGAVRQKMVTDGFSPSDIEEFFSAVRRGDGSEHKQVTPRSSPPPPPPPPPAPGAPHSAPKGISPPAPPRGITKQKDTDTENQSTNITKENNEKNKKSKGGSSGGLFSSFRGLGSKPTQEEPEKQENEKQKIPSEKIESEEEKVAPVSSMFASIRSGVALKKASVAESGKDQRVQSLPAKNPTSMHGMLLIALESRRLNSNMEKAETCSSAASPPEFDPDSD
jgi:Subunit CCDC53 of WASH complex